MDATKLLQWQYLIYLLPGGISALLLLLSSLRMGIMADIMVRQGIQHNQGMAVIAAKRVILVMPPRIL